MSKKFSTKIIVYSAICIALAIVLSFIKLFHMPQGGSVSACSMLFIVLIGYFFGPVAGITGGAVYGLIDCMIDPYIIHPAQFLCDYILAYGSLGISGFFAKQKFGLYTGYIAGAVGRLFWSTLSGVIFFASYAPEGQNVILYSLGYNGSYIAAEVAITLVLISIPVFRYAIEKIKKQATA